MKKTIIQFLAALFIVSGTATAYAQSLTWKFTNGTTTRSKIELKFYSQNRDYVWPSKTTMWGLTNQNPLTLRLDCSKGEKICYGGSVSGSTSTWGAGADGKARCTACCYICDGSTVTKNLTGTPTPKALGR